MKQNIIKWICRGLALALALILLLGLIAPALAAEVEPPRQYVALGDSMSNGYGLNGYFLSLHDDGTECIDGSCTLSHESVGVNGLLQTDTSAWPSLFAGEQGLALTQLSMSGLRAEDVLYLLTWGTEEESYADDYTLRAGVEGRFDDERLALLPDMAGQTGVEAVARYYQQSVKDADVITLSLGYNNFGTFLTSRLCYEISQMGFDLGGTDYETDLQALLNAYEEADAAQTAAKAEELLTALEEKLTMEDTDTSVYHFCKSMAEAGVYSYAGFLLSYRGILDYISLHNPDARILILGLGNAMEGVKLGLETGEIDLGAFFGTLTGSANLYLASLPGTYEELNIHYVGHEAPQLMVDTIAQGDFSGCDVLRQRILEKTCDMVLPLLGKDGVSVSLEQLEALESALADGTVTGDMEDAAWCLGVERAIVAAAGLEQVNSAAFSALMEEDGVNRVFDGVKAAFEENREASGEENAVAAIPDALASAMAEDTVQAMLHLLARFLIGDGVGCHPNAQGHETVCRAVSAAYREHFLGHELVSEELTQSVDRLISLLEREPSEVKPAVPNYIPDANSYYLAIGGAAVYGESYVDSLAQELDVPRKVLAIQRPQTLLRLQAILWGNRSEIEKADIITLDSQNLVVTDSIEVDWSQFRDQEAAQALRDRLEKLEQGIQDTFSAQLLSGAVEAYGYRCVSYAKALESILPTLRMMNESAVVVLTGMYNPLEGISVTVEEGEVPVGALLEDLTEAVNGYMAACCAEYNVAFAAVPQVETVREEAGEPAVMDANRAVECLLSDGSSLLPGEAAKEYIRDQILNCLTGVYRLAGSTRFDTAVKTANALKDQLGVEKFDTILIASGTGFADALSGSYLAAVKKAPILLSYNTKYNQMTADYIRANLTQGGRVYILGGTAAVSEEMETMLADFDVVRLAGGNRFDTNLAILEEAGVTGGEILVCTGWSFADSLSASAVGKPILLVGESLLESQEDWLSRQQVSCTVIGGEVAVSGEVEAALSAFGSVERVAGTNRVRTAAAIAQRYFSDPDTMILASAANYPDGLCGGVLAWSMDAPLLLTMTGQGSAAAAYVKENGIRWGVVLGGHGAVTNIGAKSAFGLASGVSIPER